MAAVATEIAGSANPAGTKRYTRWHELSEPPFCTKCDVFCRTRYTTGAGNTRIQFRKCPKCGDWIRRFARADQVGERD